MDTLKDILRNGFYVSLQFPFTLLSGNRLPNRTRMWAHRKYWRLQYKKEGIDGSAGTKND